jgi:hypothetical protein
MLVVKPFLPLNPRRRKMKKLTSKLTLVVCVLMALVFQLAVSPAPASARWHADPPPEGTDLTPYLVVGGLVVAGAVVYAVVHKSSDTAKEDTEETFEEESSVELNTPSLCLLGNQTGGSVSMGPVCGQNLLVNPYIDVDLERLESRLFVAGMTDVTVKAGIALAF